MCAAVQSQRARSAGVGARLRDGRWQGLQRADRELRALPKAHGRVVAAQQSAAHLRRRCVGSQGSASRVGVAALQRDEDTFASVFDCSPSSSGHRLKSTQQNKTIKALSKLRTKKRIMLTGTPVQNESVGGRASTTECCCTNADLSLGSLLPDCCRLVWASSLRCAIS